MRRVLHSFFLTRAEAKNKASCVCRVFLVFFITFFQFWSNRAAPRGYAFTLRHRATHPESVLVANPKFWHSLSQEGIAITKELFLIVIQEPDMMARLEQICVLIVSHEQLAPLGPNKKEGDFPSCVACERTVAFRISWMSWFLVRHGTMA